MIIGRQAGEAAMAELERLFADYVAEHRAGGEADPLTYLDQAEGKERTELAALIDAYLARAPSAPWDPDAFAGSPAERLSDSVVEALEGVSGTWPVLLPRLRHRAQVKRGELVRRLAQSLGAADREEKVGTYYHEMERGLLESSGVSDRVLDVLGGIVGASAEFLRRAGEPLGGGGEPRRGTVYARRSTPDERYPEPGVREEAVTERAADWDDVDELFRGGG